MFGALRGFSAGPDLAAGLTLAAIAIPEQMATARLGGFAPQIGFFAFAAGAVGFALFGSNRQLSSGADSTITPIFAGSLALLAVAGSPHYIALAGVLALMVGAILVTAGIFRLGWIADLLSTPVLTGFLAGIAVHILLSQAPSVLGLQQESGSEFQRMASLAADIGHTQLASLLIGLGVFAAVFAGERINPRIPGALIALAAATAATISLHLEAHGVAVLGDVAAGLPTISLPAFPVTKLFTVAALALLVSLVVMVQTAATTRSFSEGGDPDVNRDFIGVGAGSLLAGLAGAFPVNASPPRTSVAAQSGGRSQASGLIAAAAVLALAGFGTRLLAHVPQAALAGVLLFVAQRILHLGTFAEILRRTWGEFGLALATAILIIVLPIQMGVTTGIFLSLAHGMFITTRARPIAFERVPGTTVWWPACDTQPGETSDGVMVMGFQAPLSFLNAYDFRRGMLVAIDGRPKSARLMVLEASSIVEIDFTAAKVLCGVITAAKAAGLDFAVARLESVRAQAAFERFGISEALGEGRVFQSVQAAVEALGAKG
jgi:MFS superfamily sulfate permease-like transporter